MKRRAVEAGATGLQYPPEDEFSREFVDRFLDGAPVRRTVEVIGRAVLAARYPSLAEEARLRRLRRQSGDGGERPP